MTELIGLLVALYELVVEGLAMAQADPEFRSKWNAFIEDLQAAGVPLDFPEYGVQGEAGAAGAAGVQTGQAVNESEASAAVRGAGIRRDAYGNVVSNSPSTNSQVPLIRRPSRGG